MSFHFAKGKTALITGGSSGIGFALAMELKQRGMDIILLARRKDVLENAKEKLLSGGTGRVTVVSADVSNFESLKQAESIIVKSYARIHLLVNSAGYVRPDCLIDSRYQDLSRDIQINLMGLILCTKIFLPYIPEDGGIVNISSAFGFIGMAGYSTYSASKFGVFGFSDALRRELIARKISVHAVFPSDVDTPMYRQELSNMPEWMKRGSITTPHSPEKIAKRILKGVESDSFLILPALQVKFFYFLQYHFPRISRLIIDRLAPRPG